VTLAIFFLICSFGECPALERIQDSWQSNIVDNKYGFLVLRALQGISASMTIPSAYHLIVHLFPEKGKQQVRDHSAATERDWTLAFFSGSRAP
jgi:MFS family permease